MLAMMSKAVCVLGAVCCEGEGEGEGSILMPMRGMEIEVWDGGMVSKLTGADAEKKSLHVNAHFGASSI